MPNARREQLGAKRAKEQFVRAKDAVTEEKAMGQNDEMTKSLRRWCESQQWDWILALPFPRGMTVARADRNVRVWLREIEMKDATPEFRWARIIPRPEKGPGKDSYVMVGGLESGEFMEWAWRWGAINEDAECNGGLEYRFLGMRKPIGPVLRHLLARKRFSIEMGVGQRRFSTDHEEKSGGAREEKKTKRVAGAAAPGFA